MFGAQGTWIVTEADDRLDHVMEWLLGGLLVFMPLAFGVVEAWSEEIVLALTAVLSVCFCLKCVLSRSVRITWTWAYVPILVLLLVVVVQRIPLPGAFLRLISPETVVQKSELLGALGSLGEASPSLTISFYPHATKHDLRLLLAVAAVFVVVFNTIRRPDQVIRLLRVIMVVGVLVALETLMQAVGGNHKIYWCIPTPHDTALSGPFVNHSHFAQFMNLSIGAALGLILMRAHQRFARGAITPTCVAEYVGSREGMLLLAVVIGVASIFVSLSRGGMISMMIAGGFTTLLLIARQTMRSSSWIMVLLALVAFVSVLYIGFDAVYDRLSTLRDLGQAEGGRWQIVKDIAVAWTRFPVLGTGLGTHEVVYPMFDRSAIPSVASHAENEYAQVLEETGLVGLAALLALGALVWSSYARAMRTSRVPLHSAAYGLGFGLMAILVHSLSDFGQHVPANACLSVIFCALLIRLPRIGQDPSGTDIPRGEVVLAGGSARWYGLAGLAVVVVLWTPALLGADAARRAETHWAKVLRAERPLTDRGWQGSDEEYTYLLRHAAQARECLPDNIAYCYWLNVYRWHAICRGSDPNTGEIILSPEMLGFANRIVGELKQGIRLCPTYGPAWTFLGQMEQFIVSGSAEGANHIMTGRRLAPCNATACFVSGVLRADQGDVDAGFREWARAVALDGRLFGEVAALLGGVYKRVDLAWALAGDDPLRQVRLEQILRKSGADAALVEMVSGRIAERLEHDCRQAGAAAWEYAWLGERYNREGRKDDAIAMYNKTLDLEYGNVSCRFTLARLLVERGSIPEARRELTIILNLQPAHAPARDLLKELTRRRDSSTDASQISQTVAGARG
jgi:tetratricopeptide (TPR) repeat protein